MLKNYFKIALKVLMRRKFFTFISLFGISFTLMVLLVAVAFIDNFVSPNYPETKRDRSLYVTRVHLGHTEKGNNETGPAGFHFLKENVSPIEEAEEVAITSLFTFINVYSEDRKLSLSMKHTNAAFWSVMDFDFVEGKPFGEREVANGDRVAVITEKVKREYFGEEVSVVGEVLDINNEKYRIIGVVKGVPIIRIHSAADIYLPQSTSKGSITDKGISGLYTAIIVAKSRSDFAAIEANYQQRLARVPLPDPENYNTLDSHADPFLASWTRMLFGNDDGSRVGVFYMVTIIFAVLFMLLPAINLVNINSSRIMDRASEIGVRKAFGASSSTLVYQFIIENIIITFIGGLIGSLMAWIVIRMVNNSGMIAHLQLTMNWKVLGFGILLCLFFGFMSGVLPAFKMSRLHVVNALKANEL